MGKNIGLLWIKDDFRFHRNLALSEATKKHDHVVAFYLYKKHNVQKIQIAKKAFGDQIFHGLFLINDKDCLAQESIKTITFSDIKVQSGYMLATNSKDIESFNDNKYESIEKYIGSELLIEYYTQYCEKKQGFDYKDALPSYAGHTI